MYSSLNLSREGLTSSSVSSYPYAAHRLLASHSNCRNHAPSTATGASNVDRHRVMARDRYGWKVLSCAYPILAHLVHRLPCPPETDGLLEVGLTVAASVLIHFQATVFVFRMRLAVWGLQRIGLRGWMEVEEGTRLAKERMESNGSGCRGYNAPSLTSGFTAWLADKKNPVTAAVNELC